jgi:hypothetical protein
MAEVALPCVVIDTDYDSFSFIQEADGLVLCLWDEEESKHEVVRVFGVEFDYLDQGFRNGGVIFNKDHNSGNDYSFRAADPDFPKSKQPQSENPNNG